MILDAPSRSASTKRLGWYIFLVGVLALLVGVGDVRAASALGALRTVGQVSALSNAEATHAYPVELQGVVTYSDPEWGLLFLHDRTGSIYVNVHGQKTGAVGSRIQVHAITTSGDTAPELINPKVHLVGSGRQPDPKTFSLVQIDAGAEDSGYVLTEGVLRPADRSCRRICFLLVDASVSALVVIP